MSLSLITNISSLNAQANVSKTQSAFDASIIRLSSGFRISQASDDAAGLAISSRLTAELLSLQVAQRNCNDALSALQTADGGYNAINSLLTRMQQLAVQASNIGALGLTDQSLMDREYQEILLEIDRITSVTVYNGVSLIASGGLNASFQVGAFNNTSNTLSFTLNGSTASELGIAGTNLTSQANATTADAQNSRDALSSINSAITTLATFRATLGAYQSRINAAINNVQTLHVNISAANSRIRDVDIAAETANFTNNQILLQAGTSLLAQANQLPASALTLIRG
jgi:flagellin